MTMGCDSPAVAPATGQSEAAKDNQGGGGAVGWMEGKEGSANIDSHMKASLLRGVWRYHYCCLS